MRLFGLVAIGFWLVMMTLLVERDVLPAFGRRGDPGYRTLLLGIQDMERTVMTIYVSDQRIGDAHEEIRPNTDGGYTITSATDLAGERLGLPSVITFQSTTNIDASFHLSSFELSARMFTYEASVHGTVVDDVLVVRTEGLASSGQVEEKRLQLDGPMTLSTGLSPFTGMPELEVGKEWTIISIDPVGAAQGSLHTEARRARVEKKEVIEWGGQMVETYVVTVEMRTMVAREATAWISKEGRVLKQRVGPIEMRLEP